MSVTRSRRALRSVLALFILIVPAVSTAGIGTQSKIPAILIAPLPKLSEKTEIYIATEQNVPWSGAIVSLVFPPEACDLLILCGSSYTNCPKTFTDTTDASGKATFYILGGGCWGSGYDSTLTWVHESLPPSYLVQVLVNNQLVAVRGVRSADAVYNIQAGPLLTASQLWRSSPKDCPGWAAVELNDILFHTNPIKSGIFSPCTDINGDHVVDITDALLITPACKSGEHCTETN